MVRNKGILSSILTAVEPEQISFPLRFDLADDRRASGGYRFSMSTYGFKKLFPV